MKQTFLILIFLIFTGCAQDRIPKPDALMSSEQMINFHVDLALLYASSASAKDHFVRIDSLYVYHKIDSLTFAQSNSYYASKPKLYTKIFNSVKAELEGMKEDETYNKLETPLLKE